MATLIFDSEFDERAQYEASARGYLNHVFARLSNGSAYAITFYDHVRLGQDLEEEAKLGNPYVTDSGMIVVTEINLRNMQIAIDRLEAGSFFKNLVPTQRSI